MREYVEKSFGILVENLQHYSKYSRFKNEEQVKRTVVKELELPMGDKFIFEYASNLVIVVNLALKLSGELREPFKTDLVKKINKLPGSVIRIRRIQPSNYVFGLNFKTNNSLYTFTNGIPYLITRNSKRMIDETDLTELSLGKILREEVKMISSLSFIMSYGSCNLPINQFFCDIPETLFHKSKKFDDETVLRAAAIHHIYSLIWSRDDNKFLLSENKYTFRTEEIDFKKIRLYNKSFKILDNLSLRTAFLLIKAKTLSSSSGYIFQEDACANLFFGLEGCLRLLNRRFFGGENFNFKKTIQMVETVFQYAPGYSYLLEDAYMKRTNIVHPESKYNEKWFPILYADDYYENLEMAVDLLYHALTGDFLKDVEF